MARIEVRVAPNSRAFAVELDSSGRLKVRLTERAEKGKANAELVRELSKLLGAPVSLHSGHTSTRKVVQVGLDDAQLQARIASLAK